MFYSNQILARKGPLGLVWIAAHLDRQLKRQQINGTSIPASVDTLLDPEVPLALRLSGQLLLGVVRIYARKVNYLQQDCNDALAKIRVALQPAPGVNLPPESLMAPNEVIMLLGPGTTASGRGRGRKAAAAAAAAAAASAAAAGGAAADAGGDEFDLGMDELCWETEVLLGRVDGYGGFGGLQLGGGLELGLAPSGSGHQSQDISGVFGMPSTDDDVPEMFDIEDEEAAARWDLDDVEVEQLRAAHSQSQAVSSEGGAAGGALAGLLGPVVTPGVEGPAGKGSPVPSDAAADEDALMTQAEPEPGPAPAAAAGDGSPGLASTGGLGFGDSPLDAAAALPPTPGTAGALSPVHDLAGMLPDTPHVVSEAAASPGEDGAAAVAAAVGVEEEDATQQQQQQGQAAAGEFEMMDADVVGPPAAEGAAGAAAAGGGTPTKTFQRRNTRQQSKQQQATAGPAAAAAEQPPVAGTSPAPAADAAAGRKAAVAVQQRRSSQLLGQKRRVILDDYPADDAAAAGGSRRRSGGGGRAAGGSTRQPPTELPAAQIRALLADRAPLMDNSRGRDVVARARAAQAAASGAAALLLLPPVAPPPAAAGSGGRAALAALLGAPAGGSSRAGAAGGAAGSAAALGQVAPLLVAFGGLPVPAGLQELLNLAAAAADATPAARGAAAVAPTAALDEIGVVEDGDEEGAAGLVAAAGAATRRSLSLSLVSTPGGAAAGGVQQTPGTVEQPAAAATAEDAGQATAGASTGGSFGGSALGFDGYTPGSLGFGRNSLGPGATPAAGAEGDDGVLRDLDPTEVATHQDATNFGDDAAAFGALDGLCLERGGEEWDKENPATHGSAGKAAAAGAGGAGAATGFIGSSLRSTQEVLMPWPADAETLAEQGEDDATEVPDGGFTARTRLVMRRLQHAAAAAAASHGGGSAAAAATPLTGSKRRISAAPPPSSAAKGGQPGAPALSFSSLIEGHSRLDACRWFYEALVLENKGLVKLQQAEAYADISITPDLAAMARV